MRLLPHALLLILMLNSCTITSPRRTPAWSETELFHHPQLVVNNEVPLTSLTLWGVKLGDPESKIPAGSIREHARQGWIWCDNGVRYRTEQGNIVTLGMWDPSLLASFNIHSPDDVVARFGPTDTIDLAAPVRVYRYREGKLAVIWNDREQQLNAINISQ